jgi:hypothetical protein
LKGLGAGDSLTKAIYTFLVEKLFSPAIRLYLSRVLLLSMIELMVTKVDRRLAGLSNLLSHCSRLVVIKSVISAMPNFIMCAFKVHYTHLDHIEKSIRTFLWHGKDIEKSSKENAWSNGIKYV